MRKRPGFTTRLGVLVLTILAGCGSDAATTNSPAALSANLQPQNASLLVGVNRISLAVLDSQQNPLPITDASLDVLQNGKVIAHRPLENIAAVYGGIPVLVGSVKFPAPGEYKYLIHGRHGSTPVEGYAYVNVFTSGRELAIGSPVPSVQQKIVGDPGITLAMVDSGIPPDNWHTETIAQALAAHQPMVLFFGEPGFCPSRTCGPTVQILEQLCKTYCGKLVFEHIEDRVPAAATGPLNPAFVAFGLQSEPWVYFVGADGRVSDRYEGPVTLEELQASAQGTLAGKVPAVDVGNA